jgi:hypothetical protein
LTKNGKKTCNLKNTIHIFEMKNRREGAKSILWTLSHRFSLLFILQLALFVSMEECM